MKRPIRQPPSFEPGMTNSDRLCRTFPFSSQERSKPCSANLKDMKTRSTIVGLVLLSVAGAPARADVMIIVERNPEATSAFDFKTIPTPLMNDLGAKAQFSIVRAAEPAEPEVAVGAKPTPAGGSELTNSSFVIPSADRYCLISINASEAPDLKEWAEQKLAPVLAQWYPRLVAMLPSEGYRAPTNFSVNIRPGNGVAATGRSRITANATGLKRELNGQAIGALLHEEVHVVQQYRGGRRSDPDYKRPPGWLVEGIPDYIRWFLYEPGSHGADIAYFRMHRNLKLNYDGLYRISANFLNYVIENYGKDKDLLARVNAACRQGSYTDDLWKEMTGKSLQELNEEWKAAVQKELAE